VAKKSSGGTVGEDSKSATLLMCRFYNRFTAIPNHLEVNSCTGTSVHRWCIPGSAGTDTTSHPASMKVLPKR